VAGPIRWIYRIPDNIIPAQILNSCVQQQKVVWLLGRLIVQSIKGAAFFISSIKNLRLWKQ
jgi:hypothetical protein